MNMKIIYDDTQKDLPCDQLLHLFKEVGWASGDSNPEHDANFNIGHKNSTLVISAWDGERLVGSVRVLSDTVFRSYLLDLVVDPKYQNLGIGREMVKRCIAHYPDSHWLVGAADGAVGFYNKCGFTGSNGYLSIPGKYCS
ncbi:MAG: GNAT family N-acetyltransferase [Clostridiales bacterium]|jgi:ribosomal protein S18 acetylase RimI-like enzyme|nr:GNAT family N-acetyltransferase [Clostridiales bacterium]